MANAERFLGRYFTQNHKGHCVATSHQSKLHFFLSKCCELTSKPSLLSIGERRLIKRDCGERKAEQHSSYTFSRTALQLFFSFKSSGHYQHLCSPPTVSPLHETLEQVKVIIMNECETLKRAPLDSLDRSTGCWSTDVF